VDQDISKNFWGGETAGASDGSLAMGRESAERDLKNGAVGRGEESASGTETGKSEDSLREKKGKRKKQKTTVF